MKQVLFCYRKGWNIFVRNTILTDIVVPVEDVISPQKTTFIIPKNDKIELGDIVIIRDNDKNIVEYIGYIDTLSNKETTEISCYPLINMFDNDFVLEQICEITNEGVYGAGDADIVKWLIRQLQNCFSFNTDYLQMLPLVFRNHTNRPVFYKKILDTSNLLEAYTDVFINTGVYVVFNDIEFSNDVNTQESKIKAIYCDIYSNKEDKIFLHQDDISIQNVDIVDNTFTNYNKIIATEELPEGVKRQPKRYYFYLLNDNSITTNPNDTKRIKQVRSKEITFSCDTESTAEEIANSLLLTVYNELQAPEYNLKIVIDMLDNDNIKLYKRVDFVANNGIIYTSNITRIEKLNDLQVRLTLGALRNNMTDFKKKVEAI